MSRVLEGKGEMYGLLEAHAHEHGAEHAHDAAVSAASAPDFVEMAVDVLQDAFVDTLYLIPFLFITYLAMEWLEHRTGSTTRDAIRRAGKAGPAIGALLGVVPQCGFSAAASTLFAGRVITLGTLFAVFLSTSDEMLPIFIAEQVPMHVLLSVLGMKVVIGMAFGFAVDAVMRATHREHVNLHIHELCERDHCDCNHGCETCEHNPALAYEHADCTEDCTHDHAHHDHSHDGGWAGIAKSAGKHTVQVTLFVFLVSLALNVLFVVVGEEAIGDFLAGNEFLAIAGAAVVGLIPNCAASVAIAQLYVEGVLGLGACMAGLLSAAGVGLLVLVRANRHPRENVAIIAVLAAFSALCGILIQLSGLTL